MRSAAGTGTTGGQAVGSAAATISGPPPPPPPGASSNQQAVVAQAMAAQTNRGAASLTAFSPVAYATAATYLKQQQHQQQHQHQQHQRHLGVGQMRKGIGSWKPGGGRGRGSPNVGGMKDSSTFFCETCRVNCTGYLVRDRSREKGARFFYLLLKTWKLHLDGQKHKKKLAQQSKTGTPTHQSSANELRCDLCDLSMTGIHAFNAHIKGSKHMKVRTDRVFREARRFFPPRR